MNSYSTCSQSPPHLQRAAHFSDAFTHLQRPLQPFSLVQLQWISLWHTSEASNNVIQWTFSLFHWVIFPIFPSPQTRIRKLLVCDQWPTPAVTCLVQCSFKLLHESIWHRWYTFKRPAFPCKDIFFTFVNRWYCAGAII